MKGRVDTKERCPVCGNLFTLQIVRGEPGLFCANGCRTTPRRFFVDGRAFSVGKLYRDQAGEPLDTYGRALHLVESIRADYDKDPKRFDPMKWSNAGLKAYTLKECVRAYILTVEHGKSGLSNKFHAASAFEKHILPAPIGSKTFGELNVRDIRPNDITALHDYLKAKPGLGEVTVVGIMRRLRSLFNEMVERGVRVSDYDVTLNRVPAFPRDYGKIENRTKKVTLDREAQEYLLSMMDGWLKTWCRIFYSTGIRMGEVCALTKDDVWPNRTLRVRGAIEYMKREWKLTKEGVEHSVPISEELYQELMALPVVGNGYLFTYKDGKPYSGPKVSKILRVIYDKAGFPNLRPNWSGRHSQAEIIRAEAEREGYRQAANALGNTPGIVKQAYAAQGITVLSVPNVSPLKK